MFIIDSERNLKRTWHSSEEKAIELGAMVDGDRLVAAPKVPEGMIKPKLSADNKTWVVSASQTEINAINAQRAMSQCIAHRKARYVEVDALRAEITMDALIAGVGPDYSPAVELYQQIKAEIPKP